jgi:hypothetical protein
MNDTPLVTSPSASKHPCRIFKSSNCTEAKLKHRGDVQNTNWEQQFEHVVVSKGHNSDKDFGSKFSIALSQC